jgi:histidinol-phosphatase (PHP family)
MPNRASNSRFYDLHVHSEFSCDGRSTMEEMCRQAVTCGLRQIAFTDHVDFVPADIGYGFFQPDAYMEQVERCRDLYAGQMLILAGVEIGESHRFQSEAETLLSGHSFDLLIGSLHWLGDEYLGESQFYRRRSADEAWQSYFVELERMVHIGNFDVLGHLDIIRRYGGESFGRCDMTRHEDAIRPVLEALILKGIALEINTASLRTWLKLTSPDVTILRWYREMGGEFLTIGSDSHNWPDLGSGWDLAEAMARAAGFTHLTSFRNRTPCQIPLESA